MVAMIAVYGFLPIAPNANAVGTISDAADLITDSDVDRVATHTFTFTTSSSTPAGGDWRIIFPAAFTTIVVGNATCAYGDANMTEGVTGQNLTCLMTAIEAATTTQVVITGVTNPDAEGAQYITIENRDDSQNVIEKVKLAVVIIEDVLVTATVDSSIDFTVVGTTTPLLGAFDCSDTNSQVPTATSVPFGTLVTNDPTNLCQQLNVTTNAQDGFVVTVEQDHELLSDSGANINSFDDAATGLGSTTPQAWNAPSEVLDNYDTYGHLAISSNDNDLIAGSGLSDFYPAATQLFAGLYGTNVMTVMDHDGPSDGTTQNVGLATVMYRVQIASLQEAGDYESTLTYICTPTF